MLQPVASRPVIAFSQVREVFAAASLGRAALAAVAAGLLVSACTSSSSPTTFDLTAPREGVRAGALSGQVVVAEPVAVQVLEAERIIVRDAGGAVSFLGGGQWADRLPRLVQARLIQTFENGSRLQAISRPGDRIAADFLLNTELRSFQVAAPANEAVVEISARLVNDKTGRIVRARVFTARVPLTAVDAANAAQALDRALSTVLVDIVRWIGTGSTV